MATLPSASSAVSTGTPISQYAGKQVYKVEQVINLNTPTKALDGTNLFLGAALATADVVNLIAIPPKAIVVGGAIEVVSLFAGATIGTLTLRAGTTAISGALDCGANATAGAISSLAPPMAVSTSTTYANVLLGTLTGTATVNPTIKVTLLMVDL